MKLIKLISVIALLSSASMAYAGAGCNTQYPTGVNPTQINTSVSSVLSGGATTSTVTRTGQQ